MVSQQLLTVTVNNEVDPIAVNEIMHQLQYQYQAIALVTTGAHE